MSEPTVRSEDMRIVAWAVAGGVLNLFTSEVAWRRWIVVHGGDAESGRVSMAVLHRLEGEIYPPVGADVRGEDWWGLIDQLERLAADHSCQGEIRRVTRDVARETLRRLRSVPLPGNETAPASP